MTSQPLEGELFSSSTECAEVHIRSTWRELTNSKQQDGTTQTETIAKLEESEQCPIRSDQYTQTELRQAAGSYAEYDEKRLAQFLNSAIRLLDEEVIGNDSVNNFLLSTRSDDDNRLNLEYNIGVPSLPVSKMDWNCSGHVIAVAHGRHDHTGWCRHRGQVSIWNLALKINADRPNRCVAIDLCTTTLAFHPTQPNLLALGIFNGQILILDIASQEDIDPIMMRSTTDDLTHREPISGLEWVHNAVSNDHLLASIGADGRILLWTLTNKLSNPISGIRLAPTSMYHGHGILPNKHSILGGMAFAFSPIVDGLIVAGTEAGGLIRCQIITPTQYHGRVDIRDGGLIWTAQAAALVRHSNDLRRQVERATILRGLRRVEITEIWAAQPSPIDLYPVTSSLVYDPHSGPIRSIAFSRLHRHLFLTCSADGYFRIYHVLRSAPILSLDVSGTGLTDSRWSYSRPTVAVVTDAKGVVHVMDLLKSAHGPIISLPMNQTSAPAVSMAFNKTDGSFISSGDLEGNVAIWTLSESLYTLQPNELAFFEHLDTISDEGVGHDVHDRK